MAGLRLATLVLAACLGVASAKEENCDAEQWLPEGSEYTGSDECVPYDGSRIPDCGEFLVNNVTSYYHVHEFNCSRFWECGPQGPCMFSCGACGDSEACSGYDGLVFDCRYQYPEGPVCDWPNNVNCTNEYTTTPVSTFEPTTTIMITTTTATTTADPGCKTDDDCETDQWCDTSVDPGECKPGCRSTDDCTATSCSQCVEHQCEEPECCTTDDCEAVTNMFCSVCNVDTCSKPECCEDADCKDNQWCDTSLDLGECKIGCRTTDDCTSTSCSECVNHQCEDPECCTTDDCEAVTNMVCSVCEVDSCTKPECCDDDDCKSDQWCDTSIDLGECKPGCRTTDDCTVMSCSECVDHQCEDPECCTSDDCEAVTDMFCSVCEVDTCSKPECCVDPDCPAGYICDNNACVLDGECDANRPCEGADGICDLPSYATCEWCDLDNKECKPGCDTDANCPDDLPTCSQHHCIVIKPNGVVNITINTNTCSQCEGSGNPLGTKEGGLKVMLLGDYGTSCQSNGLDNLERVDYDNGKTAFFDGAPADDGDDDGLGGCKSADLNYGLTGGSATWTGKGEWTAAASQPVCIAFYDPDNNKPTCCCELKQRTLGQDETSDLSNCGCA